jgi:hypothetical protein
MQRLALLATLLCATWLLFLASGAVAHSATSTPPLPTLLTRYAPIVVLHPQERFAPVTVDGFLADSDLYRHTTAGWQQVEEPLPSGGSDYRLDQRSCSPRDGIAAIDCYASAQDAHSSPPTAYGNASRRGDRIVLQYWFFYAYDAYSPTVPAGSFWQVHEGDWEAVAVLLDLDGTPLEAGYSQHSKGVRREWAKVPKRGTHPVDYVALGSHANYFTARIHRFDPRVVEPLFISIIKQNGFPPVDHTGNGAVLRPKVVPVAGSSPSWMTFAGFWGEGQFLHAPRSAPVALGTSPRGPAFHALWRRPVSVVLGWPRG